MEHDAFISYAREDQQIADEAYEKLTSKGVRCWIDHRKIDAGTNWRETIVEAVTSSRVLILMLSRNVNLSRNVEQEVGLAFEEGIEILPVRLDDSIPNPSLRYCLGSAQWIDAPSGELDDDLITKIATGISKLATCPEDRAKTSRLENLHNIMAEDAHSAALQLKDFPEVPLLADLRKELEPLIYFPFWQARKKAIVAKFLIDSEVALMELKLSHKAAKARIDRMQSTLTQIVALANQEEASDELDELISEVEAFIQLSTNTKQTFLPMFSLMEEALGIADKDYFYQQAFKLDRRIRDTLIDEFSQIRERVELFEQMGTLAKQYKAALVENRKYKP